jgi:phosphoribosylformylglycinamidine synthase PurS subunit
MWVVGVGYRQGYRDPMGENTKSDILGLGPYNINDVRTLQTYVIDGEIEVTEAEKIGKELLADGIMQYFSFSRFSGAGEHVKKLAGAKNAWVVEVFFRPGVMDPVGLSVAKAIGILGVRKVKSVRTGTTYVIRGELDESEIKAICEKCLANGLIQTYTYRRI